MPLAGRGPRVAGAVLIAVKLFLVAGGGADPFAVFVGHRCALVFVGIQPVKDQRLNDPLRI